MIRLIYIFGFISGICFAKDFIKYKRVSESDGKLCEHVLFAQSDKLLTKCAMLCVSNFGCERFFFIPDSNFCMGCLDIQVQTTNASGSIGYVHDRQMLYRGCYTDTLPRVLNGTFMKSNSLTNEICWQYCRDLDYIYSGTQNGRVCFCGNSYSGSERLPNDHCRSVCAGDHTQWCGASWVNSIYG